ncbi:MAG: hypothetical protein NT145_01210 [Elusimicrobia bacterium]|nr:hypothetical protein [Elusimicrobiota bacterium]
MKSIKIPLIILVSFVLGIAFAVFSVNFGLEHFAGGYLLNIFNKKVPELFHRNISAQSIGVSLLNGEVVLKGVRVESSIKGLERPALSIPAISLKISLSDLPKNKLIIDKVVLMQPTLNTDSNDFSKKDSILSYISGLRGLGVGPKNLYIAS